MRMMLEPDRDAPDGWIVVRTLEDMLEILRHQDSTDVVEISMRGTVHEAGEIMIAARHAATSAFHLNGGMEVMHAVHFHDHDHEMALTCMKAGSEAKSERSIGVSTDTDVPIGGQSKWSRDKGQIMLGGLQLPDIAVSALIGGPLSRLVVSPMLDDIHTIHGIGHDGWSTIVDITGGSQ